MKKLIIFIFLAGCMPPNNQVEIESPNKTRKAACLIVFKKNQTYAEVAETAIKLKEECRFNELEIEKLAAGT